MAAQGWGSPGVVRRSFHLGGKADGSRVAPVLHVGLVGGVGVGGVSRVDGGDHARLGGGRDLNLAVTLATQSTKGID